MANWLSSQDRRRVRESQDIRNFITVHGKVVTPWSLAHSNEDERDRDDFSTQPVMVARPTKQLTLTHFNKKKPPLSQNTKDRTKKREGVGKYYDAEQLFLPASKFSTGVRRKVMKTKEAEENKENIDMLTTQETGAKPIGERSSSSLRRVNHRSPSSISKKKKTRLQPLSGVASHLPQPTMTGGREQKVSEVIIESQAGFLSHRKKTEKHKGQTTGETLSPRTAQATPQLAMTCEVSSQLPPGLSKDRREKNKVAVGSNNTQPDNDSDLYINTDELLEELSNCEKILLNAHT